MVKNSFIAFSESHIDTYYNPTVVINRAIFSIPPFNLRPKHTGILYLGIYLQAIDLHPVEHLFRHYVS
jgi:hypothetical protein